MVELTTYFSKPKFATILHFKCKNAGNSYSPYTLCAPTHSRMNTVVPQKTLFSEASRGLADLIEGLQLCDTVNVGLQLFMKECTMELVVEALKTHGWDPAVLVPACRVLANLTASLTDRAHTILTKGIHFRKTLGNRLRLVTNGL